MTIDYKLFYIAIRRYAKGRIGRALFLMDWEHAQRSQGIVPKKVVTHEQTK